jgi:hypothetical protein
VAIALSGTIPVSGLNLGLVASVTGLNAKIDQLNSRIAELGVALTAQAGVTASFPPNPTTYAAALNGALNVANMTLALGSMSLNGASISTEFGVKLGLVNGRIAIVGGLTASLGAGLAAGGLSGWCYSGSARGFGVELERQTQSGFGRTAPSDNVHAIIIATESLSSWEAFSEGFHTGGTANGAADPEAANLAYQGELGGAGWNTGVATLKTQFDLLKAELEGQASALEASIDVAAGLNLPSPTALVNVGLDIFGDVGISGLLDNLVNVQTDVTGAISGLNAQVALVTSLIGSLNAQLSAGGLSLWIYDGPARSLGAEFSGEIASGLPGGSGPNAPTYGVVIAGSPAAMAAFSAIFTTS